MNTTRIRFSLAVLGDALGFLAVFGLMFGLVGLAGALV